MVNKSVSRKSILISGLLRGITSLTYLFLLIEFFDEFNYGVENAALPAIRTDLTLSYVQVGMLLGLPGILNTFIEPALMLLGDTHHRKRIILAGGVAIVFSLITIASARSFPLLLAALMVGFPASGAFVSLSQGTLMELNPGREPHMMARWTLAGSLANLVGPLLLAGGFALGLGWRWIFYAMALMCLVLVMVTWKVQIPRQKSGEEKPGEAVKGLLAGLWNGLRNPRLLRWMVLLQFSDLLLDVLTGYLALYFTDVMGFSVTQASLMMSVLMLASLISNILLIPLLERYQGRNLVRISALAAGILYTTWLLVPWIWMKVVLIILIKFFTLGWYEVLDGEAFASVPGRSGTVMAIGSLFGLFGSGLAFFVGWVAAQAGLPAAMWILLAGPVSLFLFVPGVKSGARVSQEPSSGI